MRRLILACSLSLAALFAWSLAVSPINAASTITVTTIGDTVDNGDGLCSLREAIISANTDAAFGGCTGGSGADTITFDAGLSYPATIVLTQTGANEDAALTGDLDISGTLTIDGPGAQLLTIDGNQTDRVFEIRSGARVTAQGLTVQHGDPGVADGGGFLIDQTGALTVTSSLVFSNTAASGGGLKTFGALRVTNSTVEGNHGGGLRNENGLLTLSNVDVISNTGGYGVINSGGPLTFNTGLVSGNQSGGISNFTNSTGAELTNLTIMRNTGSGVSNSGATFATALALIQSQVMSNTAANGAGVTNNGDSASMTIYRSRIAYNVATASGGGVWNWGAISIISSTVDHNSASSGAGIRHNKGNLGLTNDTLSFNAATNNGGGLYVDSEASTLVTNVTIDSNHTNGALDTGGNLYLDNTSLALKNTIVSNSGPEGNCGFNQSAFMNSGGYNLDSGATCGFASAGDITNTNPLLGPLQDNGGATPTQALLPGSPAIDAGTNTGCPATDQRGLPRPQGVACDMGSYELGDIPGGYALTLAFAGSGGGSVSKSPNLTTYLPGAVVTLTASPYAGSRFDGWSGAAIGTANPISVTMDANKTVTATFDVLSYTLTVYVVGNGTVIRSPDLPTYVHGTVVVLTATADSGYVFAGWSGAANTTSNPLDVIMDADKVVTATFAVPQSPVADAGQSQIVKSNTLVTLDGSGSYDPDNNLPLSYGWLQDGGEPIILDSAVISRPTFTAPGVVTQSQTLTFTLVVTDALGLASAPAQVLVVVEPYQSFLPIVMKSCSISCDDAPFVSSSTPADSATGVAVDSNITVNFSETVDVTGAWFDITCTSSGTHTAAVTGGPTSFTLNPDADFANSETCTVMIFAAQVADQDGTPDNMAADYSWSFTTASAVAPTLVINEIDYDQPGTDNAEFIELKNASPGLINLDNYEV